MKKNILLFIGTFISLTIFSQGISEPYTVDANTVLLMHFDNNLNEESNSYSVSDHGLAKTYISNPNTDLSEAIYFDNSNSTNDSYITVPNSANQMTLSGNWTIEFWFYIESWNQPYNNWPVPIILPANGLDVNYSLEIPASYAMLKYDFTTDAGAVSLYSNQNGISIGTWYHVALINDADNHTSRILLHDSNSTLIEEHEMVYTDNVTISNATQALKIGAGHFTENHFHGYLDELRISNIVRTWEPDLQANFSANTVLGQTPLEVTFTDLSTEASSAITQWSWDFDNDGTIDSYDQNPTWIYNDLGTYSVSLTVGDGANTNTLTKTDYINVTNVDPYTRILLRSNSHFEVWGFTTEDAAADTIIKVLTANYDRIADSLNTQLTDIIVVDVYPDILAYHTAIGWPDAPDWVVGSAMGDAKIDMVTPYNPGTVHDFAGVIDVITHELVHCFVHKLANGATISTWINEGSAAYLSYQDNNANNVCYYVNQNSGTIPTLDELNNGSTYGNIGGYSFGYTIAKFITTQLGGSDVLSQFIASGLDYSLLGYQNELEFQNAWHQYIYLFWDCTYSDLHAAFLADVVSGSGPLTVQFSDFSEQGTTALTSWAWDFENDGTIDSYDQNPNWTYNVLGTYSVALTVGDGTNTSTYINNDYIEVTDSGVSINENFNDNKSFSIYPNPAQSKVYIFTSGYYHLSISGFTGHKLLEKNAFENEILDISNYDSGIYFVSIKNSNGSFTKKLIIE